MRVLADKIIKFLFYLFSVLACILFITVQVNRHMLKPSLEEIELIRNNIPNIKMSDSIDIFRVQNSVINIVKHNFIGNKNLSVKKIISKKQGYCFDRSYLLQKIFIYSKIPIRPVYIFFYKNNDPVSYIDLFNPKISSHNLFEFKWDGKWYICRTNRLMERLESIDEYMRNSKILPKNKKYIRHINNRNSNFIYPSWIPDIY